MWTRPAVSLWFEVIAEYVEGPSSWANVPICSLIFAHTELQGPVRSCKALTIAVANSLQPYNIYWLKYT